MREREEIQKVLRLQSIAERFLSDPMSAKLEEPAPTYIRHLNKSYITFYEIIASTSMPDVTTVKELGTGQRFIISLIRILVRNSNGLSSCRKKTSEMALRRLLGLLPELTNFTPNAYRLWEALPPHTKTKILSNVWCGHCTKMTTIVNYSGRVIQGDILLEGKCQKCGGKVARIIEKKDK